MHSFITNLHRWLIPLTAVISASQAAYPFHQLVAFGDELSDNGNGSQAHGLGSTANIYGFRTWTCGPVAVSYLANMLNVPLVDYSFGGCCGGSSFGATLNNSYTHSQAKWNGTAVPAVANQIYNNYTLSKPSMTKTLQFIWAGQNDALKHTNWFWLTDPKNNNFTQYYVNYTVAYAEYLASKGSPYVMVANIYPKHLSPLTATFLCKDGSCASTWGQILNNANNALKQRLAASKYAKKFIYYDVFTFMSKIIANQGKYGFTAPQAWYCDGDGAGNWSACTTGPVRWDGAKKYFWMNYVQPTTTVHQMIAADMKKTIDAVLGL